jgi:mannose-1-phosphate guanylyltransferase
MSAPEIKQAFVLGAGLGTRLRPLTDNLPKPLVPIFQKPLITFALDHLIDLGVQSFVINTHRLPEAFSALFVDNCYGNAPVRLVNEPVLLGTGGGIKNVEPLLGSKPFIAYSGDILTDVNLQPLIEDHFRNRNDVTLGLRRNTGLGAGVVMRNGRVEAISSESNPLENFDYANVSVWNQEIFLRIPPGRQLSFIPVVVRWIGEGGKIGGVELDEGKWFNIGTRAEYLAVHGIVSKQCWRPHYLQSADWAESIHASAIVDPTAQLRGCSVVGPECRVGPEAILEDTILWSGSQIASRSDLRGCIVRSHQKVTGTHRDSDI